VKTDKERCSALRAGAAKLSITPDEDFFPCTTFEGVQYRGVYAPIYVRAIALGNAESTVVILSFELLAVTHRRALRERIAAALHIPPENVFLTATHNHSVLPIPDEDGLIKLDRDVDPQVLELAKQCEENGVAAALLACQHMVPARVCIDEGASYINVNRDQEYIDGHDEGVNYEGPSDKQLLLFRVESIAGEPIAFLLNYAVHPNCEVLAGCELDNARMSGDLTGVTSQYIEERYPGSVALFANGAEGNQNPVAKNYCPVFAVDGSHAWGKIGEGIRMYNQALGKQLALDALNAGKTTRYMLEVDLKTTSMAITLPGMQIDETTIGTLPNGKWRMKPADPVEVRFQMLKINDAILFFISGEPVAQIGLRIKAESPFKHTAVVSVSDGHSGYFPDEFGYKVHTFEYYLSKIRECPADAFMRVFHEMLGKLS